MSHSTIAQPQARRLDTYVSCYAPADVCVLLKISDATLRRRFRSGRMPTPRRVGTKGILRWDRLAIDQWIAAGAPDLADDRQANI